MLANHEARVVFLHPLSHHRHRAVSLDANSPKSVWHGLSWQVLASGELPDGAACLWLYVAKAAGVAFDAASSCWWGLSCCQAAKYIVARLADPVRPMLSCL